MPKWSDNEGMKFTKDKKSSFIDTIMRKEKRTPHPQTYNSWVKPHSKGYSTFNQEKFTITTSIAAEKKSIPAPNQYKPHKDMSRECMERNPSKVYSLNKPIMDIKPKPTEAPGGVLNEKTIDVNRPRSAVIVFNKEKKETYITKYSSRVKK
jgi:hypothetical protein